MSFIIGNKCVSTCDTACVTVCPVDCIHGPIDIDGAGAEVDKLREEGKLEGLQLYINPDEWIDGGGTLWICVGVIREEDGEWGGMVDRRIAKKDRTPHKGTKVESFIKWNGCWDRN